MVGIDLRNQLMDIVTSKQSYQANTTSNSNESSFNNILDKTQSTQQKSEIQKKDKVDYSKKEYEKKEYEKKTTNSKDDYDEKVKEKNIEPDKKSTEKTQSTSADTDKNKEVVNKDKVNDPKEDKETKEVDEKLQNEILMLLSQMTGVDKEEIKNLLVESGYKVEDLLDQKKFGEFISKLYLELKNEDVLLIENAVDKINDIYKKIKNIENQVIQGNEIITDNGTPNIKDNVSLDNIPQNNLNSTNTEATAQDSNVVVNIQSTESNKYLSAKTSGTEESKPVSSISGQVLEGKSADSQMVMPISQFRTVGKVGFWSNEVFNTAKSNVLQSDFEIDIIKQIDLKQIGESKELHVKLNPKELGEMSIRLVEENSNIVAQIRVDNEKTKDLLLSQIDLLKKSLEENGLNVEDVTVDIKQNSHQSQMEQEKQKSSKRIEELINKHMNGEEFDEINDEVTNQIKISEVDYTA